MIFSSLLFIFAFLPIVLGVYYLLPYSWKNYFLILTSLFFFAWGGVSYSILIITSIALNYLIGLFLNKKHKFLFLIIGLTFNLGLLFYFKYLAFVISNLMSIFYSSGAESAQLNIILPIGISFYTFQAISYLMDVYQGKVHIQKRIDHVALYIILFPQLIAGPIVRYHEIKDQIAFRKHNIIKFASGVSRFAFGLGKKVLIANVIGQYVEDIFAVPIEDLDITITWIGTILYAFQIYFDFSGYSDMAIGLGKMFGFKFPENFNFPYAASSIKDFWRRWHITLSVWFRDYLYIPLGGNKKGKPRTLFNLTIVFIITGFWHGAAWNFLIWGLIHGLFIVIERVGFGSVLEKSPRIIGIIYAWFIVLVAWVFFREENLSNAMSHLTLMLGGGEAAEINMQLLSQLTNIRPLLIISLAFLLSTGIFNWIYLKIKLIATQINEKMVQALSFIFSIISAISPAVILIACAIELNLNSYNPFIYFRF